MYMSQSAIKITFTLALLTGLLTGFQNCTPSRFSSQDSTVAAATGPATNGGFDGDNPSGASGNGGFDGKAYLHVGTCSGELAEDTVVVVDKTGSTANFVRENCADKPAPFTNRIGELDISGRSLGVIVVLATKMILTDYTSSTTPLNLGAITREVPPMYRTAEILCTPNIASKSIPSFLIYSFEDVPVHYFADIRYPTGAVPAISGLGNYVLDLSMPDLLSAVPFQSLAPQGGAIQYYNFTSLDQTFNFLATGSGYRFNATSVNTVTDLNCYSELPGWDLIMVNNRPPLVDPNIPLSKLTSDISCDVDQGSSGKGGGGND
jgi:hypothetical protein